MPTELPIASSLSATELPQRLAQIAELGRHALVDVERSGTRATLRFAAGAGVRERVTSVVAAESACCAFLAMQVTGEPDAVVLDITGSQGRRAGAGRARRRVPRRAAGGLMSANPKPRQGSNYALSAAAC